MNSSFGYLEPLGESSSRHAAMRLKEEQDREEPVGAHVGKYRLKP
jgi:hypothetical protein